MKDVLLFDRIKEITHITGTDDIILEGASAGFSAFSDYLSEGEQTFYAITDGSKYEIGSGLLLLDGSTYNLSRNSIRSSNSDNSKASFTDGVKEVYATYPGLYSVISNPLDIAQQNRESGIAFWAGPHSVDSNSQFVWDDINGRLGVNTDGPISSVHIGGDNYESELRVSGIVLGQSGIDFVEVGVGYSTGRQREPFLRNSLCEETSGILELSGDVDQIICFGTQTAGTFLGVPSGLCPGECGDDHPIFRTLTTEDIPNLSGYYVTQDSFADKNIGNVAIYKEDKHVTYADTLRLDTTTTPNELQVSGTIKFTDQLIASSGDTSADDNTIINVNGFLVVPTYSRVEDIKNDISANNVGAIAFAKDDSYIMIANGSSWVSGQLN